MPRSSPAEMSALREAVFTRAGWRCQWPQCPHPQTDLQMAHLKHRGMGGSVEANTLDNCIVLCAWHHDQLDGRVRFERTDWLRWVKSALGIL